MNLTIGIQTLVQCEELKPILNTDFYYLPFTINECDILCNQFYIILDRNVLTIGIINEDGRFVPRFVVDEEQPENHFFCISSENLIPYNQSKYFLTTPQN